MRPPRTSLVGACALLLVSLPAPASAQDLPLASPTSGITIEAGAFVFGRDRYPTEDAFRFLGSVGWKALWSRWFMEPHLRLMDGIEAREEPNVCCPDNDGRVTEPLASIWPGLTVGYSFGNARLSHSVGLRIALGIGESTQGAVGVRYEGSARRAGWFIEASRDRVVWAPLEYDPESGGHVLGRERHRWMPGLAVGARFWVREVAGVPAPPRPPDPGIIPPEPTPRNPETED